MTAPLIRMCDVETPKGFRSCWFVRYMHAKQIKWNRWVKQNAPTQAQLNRWF